MLDRKLVLYAKKDCTDQLRKMQKTSVNIASRERIGDVYCVTARATAPDGRFDESMGVVSLTKKETVWDEGRNRHVPTGNIIPLSGDDLANALMKAETKSKRRVTLSIVGLGMLDETEIENIPESQRIVAEEPFGEEARNQGPKEPAKSQRTGRQAQNETGKPSLNRKLRRILLQPQLMLRREQRIFTSCLTILKVGYLKGLEPMFERMKARHIPAHEKIHSEAFWSQAKRTLKTEERNEKFEQMCLF